MKNNLIYIMIAIIMSAGIGFFSGIQYQKNKMGTFSGKMSQGFPRTSGQQRQGSNAGSRPVSGEITNMDEKTITIKTQDGSSKIIIYSDSTKVSKASEVSISDLKVGEQIMTIGTESSDGTVTAQSISLGNNLPPETNN